MLNIMITIDENYCAQAGTCIASIARNNTQEDSIVVYLLTQNVSQDDCIKFKELANQYNNLRINNIPLDSKEAFASLASSGVDTKAWNEIIIARLIFDSYLPRSIERIIYLDADTLVRGCLKNLWETELEDNILGAVIEPTATKEQHERLSLSGKPYFNSGILLIDVAAWKKEGIGREIISYCYENKTRLTAFDQDAINAVLSDRIKPLSPKYNWCNSFVFYPYKTLCAINNPAPYYPEFEYDSAVSDPVIIHYLGEERPWRAGNTHVFRDEWMDTLSSTPFADTFSLEEGWTRYYKCWSLFNTVMKPMPAIRYAIISKLIPLFLLHRSRARKGNSSS